jgi:Fic family protein
MKGLAEDAGRYRVGEVRHRGSEHIPPPAYNVPVLMQELIEWYNKNPSELVPVELAAVLHYRFEEIHPFTDGNGRVGRLVLNVALLKNGYPLAIIRRLDRGRYLNAIDKADKGNLCPLVRFVASAVEQSLDLYLRAIEPTQEPLQSVTESSAGTPFSAEYLSLLARKGRIPAIKVGRNWMITKSAIREYMKETERRNT